MAASGRIESRRYHQLPYYRLVALEPCKTSSSLTFAGQKQYFVGKYLNLTRCNNPPGTITMSSGKYFTFNKPGVLDSDVHNASEFHKPIAFIFRWVSK